MTPSVDKSARQQLGEVIRFHRQQRRLDVREAANRSGVTAATFSDWETGRDVPRGAPWARLKGSVSHALGEYVELHKRACEEQDAADKVAVTPTPPATTLLGQKLVAVNAQALVAPKPVSETPRAEQTEPKKGRTRHAPPAPPGAWSDVEVAKRREWALNLLRQRPGISYQGADGAHQLMLTRFGVGMTPKVFHAMKAEIQREKIVADHEAKVEASIAAPLKPLARQPPIDAIVPSGANVKAVDDVGEALSAATQLLIDCVPNLASFTLTVTEVGEVSAAYTTREVKVVEQSGVVLVGKRKS